MSHTIPTNLVETLPYGVAIEHCTITTGAALAAEHEVEATHYTRDEIKEFATVVVLPGYYATDGQIELEYRDAESAEAAAREYVESDDWGERDKTYWIDVTAYRKALGVGEDDDVVEIRIDEERHTITLEPEEPDCEASDGTWRSSHDWQSPHEVVGGLAENPGVRGHRGGVIIEEVCAHCGCYRIRDTWAQRSDTGEEGLKLVEYRDADEASQEWVRRNRLATAEDKLVGSDTRISCGKLYVRRGELTDDAADRATDEIRELLGEGYDVSWYRDDDEIFVVVEAA